METLTVSTFVLKMAESMPLAALMAFVAYKLWNRLLEREKEHNLEKAADQATLLAMQRDSMATNNNLATAITGLTQEVRELRETRAPAPRNGNRLKQGATA